MIGTILLLSIAILIVVMAMRRHHQDGGYDTWTIKKGKHWSRQNGALFLYKFAFAPHTLRFEAIFGEGCNYKDKSGGDINKLYGISYGFDNHWRSVRIGWRYNENIRIIELFSYAYVKGKREIKWLMNCQLNESIFVTLWKEPKQPIVRISIKEGEDGKAVIYAVEGIDMGWLRIMQWVYFGGTFPAPNTMKIFIRKY